MKTTILIPCLNEADTIEKAINQAYVAGKKYLKDGYEILIADNGSTDDTLKKLFKIRHIKLIKVPIRGYGAALHYGILSSKNPYIIFADADLSYDLNEINKFLPFIKKDYDLILGSRFKGKIEKGAMPILNRFLGTPFLTLLIRFIYGIKTSDCNSGMRAIKRSFYQKLIMKNSGMEWASELLIKTSINQGRYIEVPITFRRDKRKHKTHLRRWEDGWRHLKVIILLRSEILILAAIAMIAIGFLSVPFSLFTTIAMFLFAQFWILSYFTLQKLRAAIQKKTNPINDLIDRVPLVFLASLLTIFGIIQLFAISDRHLFTKYILLFETIIFDLWVFFIETIKTHLLNPLPDKI